MEVLPDHSYPGNVTNRPSSLKVRADIVDALPEQGIDLEIVGLVARDVEKGAIAGKREILLDRV